MSFSMSIKIWKLQRKKLKLKSLRKFISLRAEKMLKSQEVSITENLNEIDIVVASLYKFKERKEETSPIYKRRGQWCCKTRTLGR